MMAHLSNLSRSLGKVFLPLRESTAPPNSVTLSHLVSFEFSPHYFCTHQSSCSTASVWGVLQGQLLFAFSGNFFPSSSGYALHGGYYYLSNNIQGRYWLQSHLSCVPVSREAVADLLKGHRVLQDKATKPCKNSLSGTKRNYFWVFSHAFLTPESVFFPRLCVLGNSKLFGIPYLSETPWRSHKQNQRVLVFFKLRFLSPLALFPFVLAGQDSWGSVGRGCALVWFCFSLALGGSCFWVAIVATWEAAFQNQKFSEWILQHLPATQGQHWLGLDHHWESVFSVAPIGTGTQESRAAQQQHQWLACCSVDAGWMLPA